MSFDFAVAIVPLWHATIFPPFFVAGAIFSGFAMVLVAGDPAPQVVRAEGLHHRLAPRHCGKVMLGTGMLVCYGYFSEVWMAWYGHSEYEWGTTIAAHVRPVRLVVLVPDRLQLRLPAAALVEEGSGMSLLAPVHLSIVVLIGMWFERYVIVITLTREYMPEHVGPITPRRSGTGRR